MNGSQTSTQGNWMPDNGTESLEPSAPPAPKYRKPGKLSRNNLVLAGLFVGGLAVIGLLHVKAGPATASAASSAQNTQMDTLLATLQEVKQDCKSATANSVVSQFYYDSRKRQIPSDQLACNPFRMALPAAQAPIVVQETLQAAPDSEAVAMADAKEKVRDLSLQSVLTGSTGATAMISGTVLTVGQTIRGWTVVEIAPRQVVLQWKSHRHILSMK